MVEPQGNLLTSLAFIVWIPIALWGAYRWPTAKAAALLFLLPVMYLPERITFKLGGLPPFTKGRIAVLCLLVGFFLFHRQRSLWANLNKWLKLAIALLLIGGIATIFLNLEPLSYTVLELPGHRPYDAFHSFVMNTLDYVLPFALGAAMFNTSADLRMLVRALVGALLVYSLLQIVEFVMSPQMHNWVYGFHQHSFAQTRRGDGSYRPMVFMSHGLALAILSLAGVVAAAAMTKARIKLWGLRGGFILAYLWTILILMKSKAALVYSIVAVPLVLFFSPKTQLRVAVVIAIGVLLYPDLRASGLIPVDEINELVIEQFGEERSKSLMTRFLHEGDLLEHANERPLFGWGRYGRAMLYNPLTGRQISIRDGDWIITYGESGRVGFLGKYLLLLIPVFLAARALRYVPGDSNRRLLGALGVIIAFSVADLLPNGNYNYLLPVFSGALTGTSVGIVREGISRARMRKRRARKTSDPRPVQVRPASTAIERVR